MTTSKGRNMRRVILATCVFALAFASVAAAETSRTEYKEQVEPICQTNQAESNRILTGVKQLVKKNKLKQAGVRFAKAAAALERAEKQLAAIPQPAADSAKLTKWLSDIKGEVSLMKTIAAKFKAGNKSKGSSLVVKLTHNANVANTLVISFQFRYCKIDPSQYT
jgi:hypothetical protein